jgi:hypothetical protein
MVGKRIQFDDETWEAIEALSRDTDKGFQELADEAFADLLKKHKQPVGLKAALQESVGGDGERRASAEAEVALRLWTVPDGADIGAAP